MNDCNRRFLERNGILVGEVCSATDCHIYSSREINHIVADYNFQAKEQSEMISVADIVGYDTKSRRVSTNIFLSMDFFFDEKGRNYEKRSLGMLEYDKNNIIQKLKQSFTQEPVSLIETGEGTYTVLTNGLHRFTLLRILYLSEVAKAKGDKRKLAELRKKYTIPAKVTGVDLDKTYCKYLLTKAKCGDKAWDIVDVLTHYDSNCRPTGKSVIKYGSGKKEVLTDKLLLDLTKVRIAEDPNFKRNYPELQKSYNRYPSFREFIDSDFKGIIALEKQNLEQKGQR